jgi:hypothetical protein
VVEIADGFEVVGEAETGEADEYASPATEIGTAAYIPRSEFEPDRLPDAWSAAGGKERP